MSIAESILVGRERNRRQSKSRSNGKKRAGQLRFEKILSRGLYVFSTNEREKTALSVWRAKNCVRLIRLMPQKSRANHQIIERKIQLTDDDDDGSLFIVLRSVWNQFSSAVLCL